MVLAVAFPLKSMAGDTLQRVVDFKVLKVGMSANQPPMTMARSGSSAPNASPNRKKWPIICHDEVPSTINVTLNATIRAIPPWTRVAPKRPASLGAIQRPGRLSADAIAAHSATVGQSIG